MDYFKQLSRPQKCAVIGITLLIWIFGLLPNVHLSSPVRESQNHAPSTR